MPKQKSVKDLLCPPPTVVLWIEIGLFLALEKEVLQNFSTAHIT